MLRFDFELQWEERSDTLITLFNGHQLVINDCFHILLLNERSRNVPKSICWASKTEISFLEENDLPIIFGDNKCEVSFGKIRIGIDVFTASFFSLTRWEEHITQTKDSHGRFPAQASIAFQQGFLHRPIVDEMAALVRNSLAHLGASLPPRPNAYRLKLTHDVDALYLWPNWFSFLKKTTGDLLKRGDLKAAKFNLHSFFNHKFKRSRDPFDSYDYLMDVSEQHGLISHFYFLAGGKTKYDNDMERNFSHVQPIMKHIHERGHVVGIHPSYLSATDGQIFDQEVRRFESVSPQIIAEGRQHFLRFEIGKTWPLWEKNNLQVDSTLGFPEKSGFRCGTCTPYLVFDIVERRQLKLMEFPLIAMDTTFAVYQKSTPEQMETELMHLLHTVKKYGGTFTLLWHNTSFQVPEYQPYEQIYERFVAVAASL
ncbi:MAG: hypothetical protein GC192_02020 [Bacteroidetes bacterium]|nr:hypothetical protein [Bacteroidota bacterium]